MLSAKSSGLVLPQTKGKGEIVALQTKPYAASSIPAKLEHGVLATVKKCQNGWCRLVGEGFDGWVEERRLWGGYPGEKVEKRSKQDRHRVTRWRFANLDNDRALARSVLLLQPHHDIDARDLVAGRCRRHAVE